MKKIIMLSVWLMFLFETTTLQAQSLGSVAIEIDVNGAVLKAPSRIPTDKDLTFKLMVAKPYTFPGYDKFKGLMEKLNELNNTNTFPPDLTRLGSQAITNKFSGEIQTMESYITYIDTSKIAALFASPIPAKLKYLPDLADVRALKLIPLKINIIRDNKTIEVLDFKWDHQQKCYITKLNVLGKHSSGDHRLSFEVVEENRFNTLIINHFNALSTDLDYEAASIIRKWVSELKEGNNAQMDQQKTAYLKLAKTIKENASTCYLTQLKTIEKSIPTKVPILIDDIKRGSPKVIDWLVGWIWLNGGQMAVNPFEFTSPDQINAALLNIAPPIIDTRFSTPFTKSIDNALVRLSKNGKTASPDSILMLKATDALGQKKLVDSSGFKKAINNNNKLFQAQRTNAKLLNKTELITSPPGELNYTRYHYANRNYDLSQSINLKDYPDNYNIFFNTLNVPNKYKTALKQNFKKFDDRPQFTTELMDNLDSISSIQTLMVKSISSTAFAALDAFHQKNTPDGSKCQDDQGSLQQRIEHIIAIFYLFRDSKFDVPTNLAALKDTTNYTYSSSIRSGIPKEDSYTNTYTITQLLSADTTKKSSVGEYTFNVSRLRAIQFAAGIAVNLSEIQKASIDTAGGKFNTTYKEQKAKFIIGVKLYPFKSFLRDNGIIPRWPLKRLNIFGGFDVTDPLDNLYLGLGYDIVPGLNVNFGKNFTKQTYYGIVNNKVISSASRLKNVGNYFGITLDPEVVVGLLKIMFK